MWTERHGEFKGLAQGHGAGERQSPDVNHQLLHFSFRIITHFLSSCHAAFNDHKWLMGCVKRSSFKECKEQNP